MKKAVFILIAGMLMITAFVFPCAACTKGTIKIGAILSITGGGMVGGQSVRDGLVMAVEETNHNGGIDGRKIELIVRDSETNGTIAAEAFDELEETYRPVLYISSHSVNSMALAPLAEENNVVLLGLVTSTPEYTLDYDWVYRYYPAAADEAAPAISTLEELSVENIGLLYLNERYGNSVADLLEEEFTVAGKTVMSESLEPDKADYIAEVERLLETDAIYTVGYPNYVEKVVNAVNELNYSGDVIVSSGCSNPATVVKPEMDLVYVGAPRIYSTEYPIGEQIKTRFKTACGKDFDHYAANGYDSIELLTDLMTGNDVSREKIKELFDAGFIHPGVLGTIHIESGDHDITFPLYPAQIVDKKIVFRY